MSRAASRFIIRPCDECLNCSYALAGSRHSDRCPECGYAVAAEVVDYHLNFKWMSVPSAAFLVVVILAELLILPWSNTRLLETGFVGACLAVDIYMIKNWSSGGVALSRHGLHFYGIWNVRRRGPFLAWADLTHATHKSGVVRVIGLDGRVVSGLANITWKRNREVMARLINLGIELTRRGEQERFIERCRAVLEAA